MVSFGNPTRTDTSFYIQYENILEPAHDTLERISFSSNEGPREHVQMLRLARALAARMHI